MMTRRLLAGLLLAGAAGLAAGPIYAHGFGERYDLPIPLDYFLVGAAGAVALSFVVVGLFVRRRPGPFDYPRIDLLATPWLGRALGRPPLPSMVRLLSVAVFGLIVATALFGANRPIENLAPTVVWVLWWVGMGYVSALLGNVWMLINPWKITFEWAQALIGGDGERGAFDYPERLDVWPAVVIFLVFAWLENVYPDAAQPQKLGILVVLYSLVTWAGMAAFGKHEWLRRGEAFSVLFGLFARFSPTEVRSAGADRCAACAGCEKTPILAFPRGAGGRDDLPTGCIDCYECFEAAPAGERRLNLRPYAVGLVRPGGHDDGDGPVRRAGAGDRHLRRADRDLRLGRRPERRLAGRGAGRRPRRPGDRHRRTAAAPGPVRRRLPRLLLGRQEPLRREGVRDGRRKGVRPVPGPDRARLQPGPLHLLLLIQGQLVIPLASDPFGFGWDLFGSAGYRLNIDVIDARTTWIISIAAIVVGHIVSVYVAHEAALRRVADGSRALRGQYPMLMLMVLYTATSLWIIAQPIVNEP